MTSGVGASASDRGNPRPSCRLSAGRSTRLSGRLGLMRMRGNSGASPRSPADYARAFRERYGLHEAPYENGGLPMGFTRPRGLLGLGHGLGNDCLLCHGGTVAGQTIVGLGNTSLDMQSLYEELSAADGLDPVMPLPLCNVRGTSEASNFAIYLMQFRDKDLRHRVPVKYPLCTTLCEDIPAWWLFKKKRTIYHLGVADSRSVRTMMPFLLIPGNSAEYIKEREPDFADIRAFLLSVEPPKYPFPIDQPLASQGKVVFERTCARCHGTYGPDGRYPNKIIPLDVIGTDPTLATAFAPAGVVHYLNSWFAEEHGPARRALSRPERRRLPGPAARRHLGDGTVSPQRLGADRVPGPEVERSARGFHEEFPLRRGGFRRATAGPEGHPARQAPATGSVPAIQRRRVYDTSQPGRGHGGHTFGDSLGEDERMAVIEYLKTL